MFFIVRITIDEYMWLRGYKAVKVIFNILGQRKTLKHAGVSGENFQSCVGLGRWLTTYQAMSEEIC